MRDLAQEAMLTRPSRTHMPLMSTRELGLTLGTTSLLRSIDIDIPNGKRTMVMGANGAGKSLLLRLLHGLTQPTEGTVNWRGTPLDKAARRAQSMVFQRPVLLRRSVRANLRFALRVRGILGAEAAEREAEALERAGLSDLAQRPARVLSGGEQQRLAVARALACRPELLFLDEPTASLDPAATLAIERLVLDAQAAGVTIVMVTHDLGQARRLGQEVVFLHGGQVAEAGPASLVLERPTSEAARAWLDGRIYLPTK